MAKRALITGITGQDGSYLAELLLEKGYEVHGLVRQPERGAGPHLAPLEERLVLHAGDLRDGRSLQEAVGESQPDEVYNLAALSRVPLSWERAEESADCNALGVVRLLDAIATGQPEARFFQASSSEIFGASTGRPQDESTPLRPSSPYGAAKAYGHLLTGTYRRRGLFACSGILFNHESPRRPPEFVSRRVTAGAAAIKLGQAEELPIGNLQAQRDWGYAPEYMEAAWLMLQQEEPGDFVLGSGRAHSVAELAEAAFAEVGLEADRYLRPDPAVARPADDAYALANPGRAADELGWKARTGFAELVKMMIQADLERLAG